RADYVRARISRKRDCTHSDSASGPLHQYSASSDVAPNMDCAVSRDSGYSKASAFLGHVLSERCDMIERNNGELRGRPERAVRLRTVAPHLPTNPFGRYAFADLIHRSGPVAVRDNTRIGHPQSK